MLTYCCLLSNYWYVCLGIWRKIGRAGVGDVTECIGIHGLGTRNSRGDTFSAWATTENMVITNTLFDKTYDKKWTHRGPYGQRQFDYGCIELRFRRLVQDAEASNEFGIGLNHRAVRVVLELPWTRRERKHFPRKCSGLGGDRKTMQYIKKSWASQ